MKNILKKLVLVSLLGVSSLNLLADDVVSLDKIIENNQNKYKTLSEMTEVLEKDLNSKINLKYNCTELFNKFKSLPEDDRRLKDFFYKEVFVLYNDDRDLKSKPKFLGVRYISVKKDSANNNCSVEIKDSDYISEVEKEKMKLLPDMVITTKLFEIYFDDLIKNINIKNDSYLDYVAMYNLHKTFKDDLEITNFLKNNLNDEKGFTKDKEIILRALVNENYKIILEKEKQNKLEENKKITKNNNVLKKLETELNKDNDYKLKFNSYENYPFSY